MRDDHHATYGTLATLAGLCQSRRPPRRSGLHPLPPTGYLSRLPMTKRDEALEYHARGRPGKIAVVPTKPLNNQRDLSLAYSPGVAVPCLEIESNPDDAYKYTAKGN